MTQPARKLKSGEYRMTTHMLWTEYSKPLSELAPFKTGGSLWAVRHENATGFGRLPGAWWTSVLHADYIVYSYVTPIAWHIPAQGERWVMPLIGYSRTTTRHQGIIRTVLGIRGEYMKAEETRWQSSSSM